MVPRLHAHALVDAVALHVLAARVPVRRPRRGQRATGPPRARVRAARHRRVRRRPLLRDHSRHRQGHRPTTSSSRFGSATPAPTRPPSTCCRRLWFRNTWSWGRDDRRPSLTAAARRRLGRRRAPQARPPGAGGRRRPRAALLRERDQRRAAVRRAGHDRVPQGRHRRPRRQRRRDRQPRQHRHQGGVPLPPRDPGRRHRDGPLAPVDGRRPRPDGWLRVERLVARRVGGRRVLRRPDPRRRNPRRSHGDAPGLRRDALDQAVLQLQRRRLARRRPGRTAAARTAPPRPQRPLAPHGQLRRHLDAGHVGVPLVRGVGLGVPLRHPRPRRPRVRQGAAPAVPPRVVPAPERPDPGLRVELRRRQPAGARLGRAAGVRDRRPAATTPSWPRSSRSCSSTSRGGSTRRTPRATTCSRAASSGSTTSARSTGHRSCPRDCTSSRATARRGWRCTPSTCCSIALVLAEQDRVLRGHRLEVLRALRPHHRGPQRVE